MTGLERYLVRNTVAGFGNGEPLYCYIRRRGVSQARVMAELARYDVVPGPSSGPGLAYYIRTVRSYKVEWSKPTSAKWWEYFGDNGDWIGRDIYGAYPIFIATLRGGRRVKFDSPQPVRYEDLPNFMKELWFSEHEIHRLAPFLR